ncbi:MAG: hypothetical protein ACRD1C_08670 [Terriglobales bacterium]
MKLSLTVALAFGLALPVLAHQVANPPPLAPGSEQLVVTALGDHDAPASGIEPQQVQLKEDGHVVPIAKWAPFPSNERLDLAVAIDDDTRNLGTGLDDIKTFIRNLPANVAVGVLYLRTGSFEVAQNFTFNHAAAAKMVRMPSGARNSSPSPFGSLHNLIAHWPYHSGLRRELVMISDGQEEAGENDADNHTYQAAVAAAVAGGVVVYTIYASGGTNYAQGQVPNNVLVPDQSQQMGALPTGASTPLQVFRGSNLTALNGSQNLSLLAAATGGEGYSQGVTSSARLTQYFGDIAHRLAAQYQLVFTPSAAKAHGMTKVEVNVHHRHAQITAPKDIYLTPR